MSASPNESLSRLLDLERIRAELAQRGLRDFIRAAWPIIEPGTPYLDNWHIHAIADHLEAVTAGQIRRLLINMPPRYMKSICVSVMWPAWEWIKNPAERWMFASYASGLSIEHSLKRRDIITSDWYQRYWGDRVQLVGDQNLKGEYKNSAAGVMFATSITGTATGKGGNRLVVDDPHDPTGAESDQVRQGQIDAFDRKFYTRLNDKKHGAIVIVMQRLHEKDLSGHILAGASEDDEQYVHLCLPAEAKSTTTISAPGGNIYHREAGELLWPEREGPKELRAAKLRLGSYGYAGQYAQTPSPSGGGMFEAAWYRYFEVDGEFYRLITGEESARIVKASDCRVFVAADIAGTEKRKGNDPDYTVIGTYAMTPTYDLLLLDWWRQRKEAPDVEDALTRIPRAADAEFTVVEQNGLGLPVVQTVRRRGINLRGIVSRSDKVVRAQVAQIRMEAGTIYLPKPSALNQAWLHELKTELEGFPNVSHDDQVDCLSVAAAAVQRLGGPVRDESDDAADQQHAEANEAERQAADEKEREAFRQQLREEFDEDELDE